MRFGGEVMYFFPYEYSIDSASFIDKNILSTLHFDHICSKSGHYKYTDVFLVSVHISTTQFTEFLIGASTLESCLEISAKFEHMHISYDSVVLFLGVYSK